jgi:hypothetical protein
MTHGMRRGSTGPSYQHTNHQEHEPIILYVPKDPQNPKCSTIANSHLGDGGVCDCATVMHLAMLHAVNLSGEATPAHQTAVTSQHASKQCQPHASERCVFQAVYAVAYTLPSMASCMRCCGTCMCCCGSHKAGCRPRPSKNGHKPHHAQCRDSHCCRRFFKTPRKALP